MNKQRLSEFCGHISMPLVDAMTMIDENAQGIIFIVDNYGKLIGSLTDGDIRRWIIQTGELHTTVEKIMNKTPKYLFSKDSSRAIEVMKKERITAIPITDNRMKILDIILFSEKSTNLNAKQTIDLSAVPVIIMAGGKGTRLYPFTKILPKPLIPIGDTPIVERIINYFTGYGIEKFYMTVNYKKGMIRSYFSDLNPNYKIQYVEEDTPLGTAGSIKLIEDKFQIPVFVTNCDALVLADYGDLYEHHIKSGNDVTMVSALKNIQVPYGVLHAGENGELLNMEEKPKLSYLINTGMYVMNPEIIELIPDNVMFHMPHLVEKVMDNGGKVGMYPVSEESFLDMGEFDEMKRMEKLLNVENEG